MITISLNDEQVQALREAARTIKSVELQEIIMKVADEKKWQRNSELCTGECRHYRHGTCPYRPEERTRLCMRYRNANRIINQFKQQ